MRLVLVAVAAVLAAGWVLGDEKDPGKKIAEMMRAAHKGEKSPLARTGAELKKDAPDWDQVTKDARVFVGVGDALKGRTAYTSPEKYITSAAALEKAAREKDKTAAGDAFAGLTKSCSACHYGGARTMTRE